MRSGLARTLSAVAVLALGCAKNTVASVQPVISVQNPNGGSLGTLTFPLIAFGTSESQAIVIQSLSNADLQVTLQLSGAQAGSFSVSPAGPITVPATQAQTLTIQFAPPLPSPVPDALQQNSATLTVASN